MRASRPSTAGPELLIRESAHGWACYGAVAVRDLIRQLEGRGMDKVHVYDGECGHVVGVLTRSDLAHLVRRQPRGPIRMEEAEWLVKGTRLRLGADPLRDPDLRAVLLLSGGPGRAPRWPAAGRPRARRDSARPSPLQ